MQTKKEKSFELFKKMDQLMDSLDLRWLLTTKKRDDFEL